ncbi:RidA family protein [Rothia endophytica]|uniref:RidA family protein n=1 Tax=Rothia endophytica TaxID=1324766 RepID=UPI001F46AEE3|nr:RidA family protein [Rothia endophytica]
MSTIEDRIRELGYNLPELAAPVAAYVPAVTSGNYVYTSGQLPFVKGELPACGKVSASGDAAYVSSEKAQELAALSLLNALAAVKSVIGDLDRVTKVVKVVGFVASEPNFTAQPAVINGASLLLGEIFGEAGQHARSAVGVPVLPLDSPVEIEIIVEYA